MLTNLSQLISLNASSTVNLGTEAEPNIVYVAYMTATIQPDGKFSVNQAIQNKDLYVKHATEMKTDYDAFYAKVLELSMTTE